MQPSAAAPPLAAKEFLARQGHGLRVFFAFVRIYLRECFAYPAAAFIWIIADTQAAIILPAVWLAAEAAGGSIPGMAGREIVTYYLISMTIAQFVTCHLMWDIAWDIKEGFFSMFLVRPMSVFSANVARNLAWRLTKILLFVPVWLVVYFAYLRGSGMSPLHFSGEFWIALILGHTLSYVAAYCIALTALWTTEFYSVLRLYYFPETFLSGRLVPLAALPAWAGGIGAFLHFRYTNAFMVEMLMGRLSDEEVRHGLLMQGGWILFFLLLGKVLFARGRRRYTGVGM
jgi:ABC-2 type transport system permease protein